MAILATNGSDLHEFIWPSQEAEPIKEFLEENANLSYGWYNRVVSNIGNCCYVDNVNLRLPFSKIL